VVSALVVSAAAAKRLSRTGCLRRTAYVVVAGQVLTFLAAEGAGRVANGLGPVDPDGLVGAGLQAAVAVALLVVVTSAWAVAVRTAPLQFPLPPAAEQNSLARTTNVLPSGAVASWVARGPPAGACT
jgi:hypothetical protein